jgi:hypothetical protein
MENSFGMRVEAETMTPEERSAHEKETLQYLREQLERLNTSPDEFREVREVRLEGTYPETRVVVAYWDPREDKERSASYELWRAAGCRKPLYVGHEGRRESPYTVAMLIATYVHGG